MGKFTKCKKSVLTILFIGFWVITAPTPCSYAQSDSNSTELEAGFKKPPDEARPRVWWHWMNGNITKEGIRADLEWMHRVGIAGFQNFDAAFMTPPVVENRRAYMTPEWKEAFTFATRLADSLDMEMAIAGSPGWSESGGPWVEPDQGMKKYVWSKTRIKGGEPFDGKLPDPPTTTGPFQDIPLEQEMASATNGGSFTPPEYYKDVAVIAFRLPDDDKTLSEMQPGVTSSGGNFNLSLLTDGDVATTTMLPPAEVGENAWVQYEFSEPRTFQSLTIVGGGGGGGGFFSPPINNRALKVSDDGKTFQTALKIPGGGVGQRTLEFEPVTAKYFRFTFKTQPPQPGPAGVLGLGDNDGEPPKPSGTEIAELNLHTGARVNQFEDKAAFTAARDIYDMSTRPIPASGTVKKEDVITLTSKMKEDGTLSWTPPEGTWIVLRLGYSLLGITNHPASAEATGLEVDKMSKEDVKSYFAKYLDKYESATSGMMGKEGLQYIITDSWEAGAENWTDSMMEEFRKRRGYSMLPWVPVLAGHVVESAEASDRFLWDFRQTIADLITENHYDQLTEMLKERGMGRYSESHESGRALIADGMDVKRTADIPMSAMWVPGGFFRNDEIRTGNKADIRESASVAHIYGQDLVAAESMTSAGQLWAWSPQSLKPMADMELAHGLNRFVIHTSVHQPVDDKMPGFTLGPFGQTFNRHETWAEQARPWIDYLARSSYMLQQGQFVADVAYYYGQDSNITALFEEELPPVPEGYNYDFVNTDALLDRLSVRNGNIITSTSMRYRVLALDPNTRQITLSVLHKIRELVNAGATIIGDKPIATPSLSDDQKEFQTLANKLWSNENGVNQVGKGKIYAGQSVRDVLPSLNVAPDFTYTKPQDDTKLLYVHRQADNADLYWINNRNDRIEDLQATFRVTGKEAELWDPVTGEMEEASYSISDGVTNVPLHLDPNGAIFVVFRTTTNQSSRSVPRPTQQTLSTIQGPWEVHFQEDRGAPSEKEFESLVPWNEHPDKGIKYFSGTGTYTKTIQAPASWFTDGTELWLDLGDVKNLAEVVVNGISQGIAWKEPFRVNITEALKQGSNSVEIKVTNLWVNRLIGDQQPDVSETYTWTTFPGPAPYKADEPLKTSGLLGPVKIISLD